MLYYTNGIKSKVIKVQNIDVNLNDDYISLADMTNNEVSVAYYQL